jgi:tetratricopeptide (TPR) repeat protein
MFTWVSNWFKSKSNTPKAVRTTGVEKTNAAFIGAIGIGGLALFVLLIYAISIGAIQGHRCSSILSILAVVILIAFASFAVGGVIGFLFGIPRTLQHSNGTSENENSNNSNYSNNTNLEQISDWLTKIMVGVGLTQIHKIIVKFNELSFSLGSSLETFIPRSEFAPVAGAIMIMFLIDGFLIVYLWTRLFLAKIQDASLNDKLNQRDNDDKQATSIANNQLNLPLGVKDFSVDDLFNTIKKATGTTISNIFFKAVNIRKLNWNGKPGSSIKNKMERTIPIFRTLIKLDRDLEFPENYAELGYALKDQTKPDYKEALDNLSTAIEGFKKTGNTQGIGIVYFNRAFCQIQLDDNFNQSKASADENYNLIKSDIDEAAKEDYVKQIVEKDETIKKWQELNKK